jgi:6,7-dimethyl-8-ribityllumazine synthase
MAFAIAIGRFYEDLAERLLAGAQARSPRRGRGGRRLRRPRRVRAAARGAVRVQSGRYDGVACLGAVIRGETDHYDFVCAEAARGIQDVQLRTGVPCAFGVLTVENMDQALARTGGGKRDQGRHAAEAVLRMAALRRELGVASVPPERATLAYERPRRSDPADADRPLHRLHPALRRCSART